MWRWCFARRLAHCVHYVCLQNHQTGCLSLMHLPEVAGCVHQHPSTSSHLVAHVTITLVCTYAIHMCTGCIIMPMQDHHYGFLTCVHGTFFFARTGGNKCAITRSMPWFKQGAGVAAHLLCKLHSQFLRKVLGSAQLLSPLDGHLQRPLQLLVPTTCLACCPWPDCSNCISTTMQQAYGTPSSVTCNGYHCPCCADSTSITRDTAKKIS